MAKTSSKKKPPIAKVGDRIRSNTWLGTVVSNSYTSHFPYKIKWDNGQEAILKEKEFALRGYEILAPEPEAEDIADFSRDLEPCKISEPVDSSRESGDSLKQLSLLGDSIGEYQSNTTEMRSQSWAVTSAMKFLGEISENFTQTQANTIYSVVDSPVEIHQEPATELELLTYLQNLGQCSESSSESLERPDPSLSFWSNLADLSIEVLERGWEDCAWADIKASIQSSRQRMNLARTSRGSDYLSFPTLLAGHGNGHQDVGLTECEKWWKQNVIREIGLQLSSEAIACLHGFPANWFRSISPQSVAQPVTQADSQPENSEAKPSQSPRQESLLNGSSGCGRALVESLEKSNFPFKKGDIVTCDYYPDRELEVTEELDHPGRMGVKFLDGGRAGKTFYTDKIVCHLLRRGNQSPACHQSTEELSEKLKTEEELTPVDTSAIGKHFWCDRLTVAVEILTVHNWRETPHSPEIIKGARCRPWWNKDKWGNDFPECLTLALNELLEIEEFSSPLPEPDIKNSLEKPRIEPVKESQQVGSLYQYTANRTGKDGVRREYPIVEGRERDRANDDDWYWGLSYIEKNSRGKWCDRSASIPRPSLPLARAMMRAGFSVATTIEAAQLKFCWLDFRGSWAIGEVRPEACPRLAIISFEARQVLIIPSSQWGELKVTSRQRLQGAIQGAIAEGKSFSYIKEILNAQ